MKILCNIPGGVTQGFQTPTRGEGMWALSLARLLSDAGHEVCLHCSAGVDWGSYKCPPNVTSSSVFLIPQFRNVEFDAYLTVGYDPTVALVKAKKYLFCTFGLSDIPSRDVGDKEYILVLNKITYNRARGELEKNNVKWVSRFSYLGAPCGKELGTSQFDRKGIVFTAKDIFHPNLTKYHEDGANHIFAAIDACKETGAKFLCAPYWWDMPDFVNIVNKLGILQKVKEIPNSSSSKELPRDIFINKLKEYSVGIPVNFAGSIQDLLFNGLVALPRLDGLLVGEADESIRQVVREMWDGDSGIGMSRERLKQTLIRLLTDREFYDKYQKIFQSLVYEFQDSEVLKQFNAIMEM